MTKKTKIDIADFDTGAASDKGFDLELLHPTTQQPLGVYITVLGKHGQVFREHLRDQHNERQRAEAQADRKGKELPPITAEESEAKAIELLAVSTTGWFTAETEKATGNLINKVATFPYKGEELPFSVPNVLRVYNEQIWVRAQVDGAIGDLENFIKG